MRVLLDTNVLLDSMLQRPPWHADADAILQAAGHGEVTCAATVLSLANLFYVGRLQHQSQPGGSRAP
jgi:predicted nucleic acid-binding protein